MAILLRRGDSTTCAGQPLVPLAPGEPGWDEGTHTLYVGSPEGNILVGPQPPRYEGVWTYSNIVTDPVTDPGNGRVRLNNATPSAATQMGIARLTANGTDFRQVLQALQIGDVITAYDQANTANWVRYTLQAAVVDNTEWFLLPLTYVDSGGGAVANNADLLVTFGAGGAAGGGGGYSDEQAQDAVAAAFAAGTHAGITIAYDDAANTFTFTVTAGGAGTVTSVQVSGGSTGLTFSGGPITSSGTITMAGTLAITAGGTGATTAAGALSALGGQPLDADLTALAGVTGTNTIYYRSGANTWTAVTIGTGLSFSAGTLAASNAGTVTSVSAGTGLTSAPNPITATGTIALVVPVAVAHGGTGATSTAGALSALGGQPLDAGLTSLANAASTGSLYYLSAADTWSTVTIGTGLTFAGGTLSSSITPYTNEQAQDTVAAAFAAGTHTAITVTYDDTANALSLANTDRGSTAVATHEGAGDPHPQYLTTAEGDARYPLSSATDPYPQYLTATEANGAYQPLDGDLTSLAGASATNTLYYRSAADTWAAVTIGAGLTFTGGTLAATATTITVSDTATIDLTLAGSTLSADARAQLSLTSDAAGLKLAGDVAAPGNSMRYGTDAAGVKGWFPAATGTGTVSSVDASGGTTGLTFAGGPITTSGTLTLGGTLAVASGGTGATTLTGYVKGAGTAALTAVAQVPAADLGPINLLSPADPDVEDSVLLYETATASNGRAELSHIGALLDKATAQVRLSYSDTQAVPTADQTSKTTLFLLPYRGNRIALYDNSASRWKLFTLAVTAEYILIPTSTGLYDVFVYPVSATTVGLEFSAAWTDPVAGTRANALALMDGIWTKAADPSRRWLGTLYNDATLRGEDSARRRWLYNWENQVPRRCQYQVSATHTNASSPIIPWNNDATNRMEMALGQAQDLQMSLGNNSQAGAAGRYPWVSLGLDSTTTDNLGGFGSFDSNAQQSIADMTVVMAVGQGYHKIHLLESSVGNTSVTFYAARVDSIILM